MSKPIPVLLLTCLAGLLACDNEISSASRLRRVRLLAVQAEPPNPALGQTTRLRPLVYLPPGESVTYEWSWCPVPTSSDDGYRCPVEQPALDELAARLGLAAVPPLFLGTTATIDFTNPFPPALLASLCAGDSSTSGAFFGGAASAGTPQVYDCTVATLPVQVMLTIRGSITDTGVVSLRLPIDETTPGNANPVITGISVTSPAPERLLDESGLVPVPRDEKVELRVGVEESQAEVYLDRQLGPDGEHVQDSSGQFVLGPTVERLLFMWFAEGGGFVERHSSWSADDRDSDGQPVAFATALDNEWTTPKVADYAPTSSRVLVVVRDSRGGVAWAEGTAALEVAP
jgi:hypothetical protein